MQSSVYRPLTIKAHNEGVHSIRHSDICLCFEDEPLPASWPQYGNIEFRNVSLKHPTQNENFIADLNLTIPAGQRVSL